MKIICSPLLYGRTFSVDFSSKFLAQPDFFNEREAAYAFSVVTASMDHNDFVGKDGRNVVFRVGDHVVIGLVTEFEQLFVKCGCEPKYHRLDHEGGRPAHGFIGVVLPRCKCGIAFELPANLLMNLYCDTIAPIWERTIQGESLRLAEQEIDVPELLRSKDVNLSSTISNCLSKREVCILDNSDRQRDDILHVALSLALNDTQIVFCSNADEIRQDYLRFFNVITCADREKFLLKIQTARSTEESARAGSRKTAKNDLRGYDRVLTSSPRSSARQGGAVHPPVRKGGVVSDSTSVQKRKVLSYDDILERELTEDEEKKPFLYELIIKFITGGKNHKIQQDDEE